MKEAQIYANKIKIISMILLAMLMTFVSIMTLKDSAFGYAGIFFFGIIGIPVLVYGLVKKWNRPIMYLDKEGIRFDVGFWSTKKVLWDEIEKIEFGAIKTRLPARIFPGFINTSSLFFFFKDPNKYNQVVITSKNLKQVGDVATDTVESFGFVKYRSSVHRRADIIIPSSMLSSQKKIIDIFGRYNIAIQVINNSTTA